VSNNESAISMVVEDSDIFFSASYLLYPDVKTAAFNLQKCSYSAVQNYHVAFSSVRWSNIHFLHCTVSSNWQWTNWVQVISSSCVMINSLSRNRFKWWSVATSSAASLTPHVSLWETQWCNKWICKSSEETEFCSTWLSA